MIHVGRFSIGAVIGLGFALVFSVSLSGAQDKQTEKGKQGKAGKKNQKRNPNKLALIFPPDTQEGAGELVSDEIISAIRERMEETEDFAGYAFVRSSPRVRRAISEQSIGRKDADPPYDQNTKAKRLAEILGYKIVLVGTINEYKFDREKRQVTLDLSLRLVDFTKEKPDSRLAGESITSPADPPQGKKEDEIAIKTARELTEKLTAALLKPKSDKPKTGEEPEKSE